MKILREPDVVPLVRLVAAAPRRRMVWLAVVVRAVVRRMLDVAGYGRRPP
jgi:hypothetical protein